MVLSALTLLSVMALTAGAVYQSVPVGHSVTLNCSGSAAGLRGIPEDQLHIEWKRSGDLVFNLISGSPFPGPEFKHRAAVSREKISQENFSVTISPTRFSDEGHYECFCGKGQEQLTFLGEVYLVITAFSDVLTLQCGNTLSLPLLTADPVEVLFENLTSVCSVQNSTARCVPQYRERVSVQDGSLTLRSLTPADQGRYTVRDLQGNTISTVTLTVGGEQVYSRVTRGLYILDRVCSSIILCPDCLSAHRDTVTLQPEASLSVPLFTGEPVEVLFDPAGGGNWTSVCSVQDSIASCVPQYRDRVSVQDGSLTLRSLTPADHGSYTVRDLQGNAISTVTLTVGAPRPSDAGVSSRTYVMLIPPFLLLFLALISGLLGSRCHWWRGNTTSGVQKPDRPV
ncbi:uncharacterized protein [Lepisosteus oculatus]|nr:PREDICTED: uncharacterized protein LOC107076235 isoform X3 [Lepisosteus oculatus]XP_015195249.1 PREDICTED: uncharacterized protein LOC107076235 isoform X3 [Lepisosteus oculatus]XP_015195250.1 PREDICTED: uncharacterized protein LOC107076235 isoform X3 [Lepisosteus oculatus]